MKIKMQESKWKEIGKLSGIVSVTLDVELGQGTVFKSSGGVEVFLSKEDLDILTGAGDSGSPSRIF